MGLINYLKTQILANKLKTAEFHKYVETELFKILPELKGAKAAGKNLLDVKLSPDQLTRVNMMSSDALEVIKLNKLASVEKTKSGKDIFFNFFGMNEHWPLSRNILGGLMVHCPEWPTYFIPAYTQAKSSGDATDLKKGEGPRGLITGGLEGIAVGALVSGRFLKGKEMVPYIILGAGLQLFSCKVFPWLGEKLGQQIYNKRLQENGQNPSAKTDGVFNEQSKQVALNQIAATNISTPKFKGRNQYCQRQNIFSPSGLKI